jgi:uncharacterized protein YdaU (DUF1376 family)
MNRSPAFQFYPGDWLSSSRITLMTPAEEGAYIRLLAYCWDSEDCTLPDDDEQLAKLSRLGEQWLSYAPGANAVRNCFEVHPSKKSRLINKRLFAEWKKLLAFRRAKSQAGKKGMANRWKQKRNDQGVADSSVISELLQADNRAITEPITKHSSSSPSPSSSLSSKKKPKNTSGHRSLLNGHQASFELFWDAYPRKKNREEAERAWRKLKPDDGLLTVMLSKLDQDKRTRQWRKDDGEFIPYPENWLNDKRWEDEHEAASTNGRIPL